MEVPDRGKARGHGLIDDVLGLLDGLLGVVSAVCHVVDYGRGDDLLRGALPPGCRLLLLGYEGAIPGRGIELRGHGRGVSLRCG